MFLPIEIQSINRREQLKAGNYAALCNTYVAPDGTATMIQFEYKLPDEELVAACDIVLVGPHGAVRACDFMRMPDRSWRDSFGGRADLLLDLLPREVANFRLVEQAKLGVQTVGETA
jgi:hypothetical protein